jgi:hypothetical protein
LQFLVKEQYLTTIIQKYFRRHLGFSYHFEIFILDCFLLSSLIWSIFAIYVNSLKMAQIHRPYHNKYIVMKSRLKS